MRSHRTTMAASALALAALVALPADADTFTSWDVNGDGHISAKEFIAGWGDAGVFYRAGVDHDGNLSKQEPDQPRFGAVDANDDSVISTEELGNGVFDHYDVNDDNILGRAEWQSFEKLVQGNRMMAKDFQSLYATWDTNLDGVLSEAEFERGLAASSFKPKTDPFGRYDVNGDQLIGRAEWQSFADDAEANGWFAG